MATVTQQEVAPLQKQLDVTILKEDYLPSFEQALKDYSKKANIPGFRKGMVPAGLIKKMYGHSLFMDEVLKIVDKEVVNYLETEKLQIFAQPLPKEMNLSQIDVTNPGDYTFSFDVGMKPEFQLPDFSQIPVKRYVIDISDDMIEEEVERLRNRYGNMTEPEAVTGDENVLNVTFKETDETGNEIERGIVKENSVLVKYFKENIRPTLIGKQQGEEIQLNLEDAFEGKELEWILNDLGLDSASGRHFKIAITKVGLVEKRELNEEFYEQLFPGSEVKNEEDFKNKIRQQLQTQWNGESRNQLHHQLYHQLLEGTNIELPENFLKNWMKTQGAEGEQKSGEEVENEFPTFKNQLKWSLITEKLISENDIQVQQDEIRQFAKQQLFGYMGGAALDEEQQWVRDYIDKMMKDRKYVEESYSRIQTQKMFDWMEGNLNPVETSISKEDFMRMNETHKHEHHEE
jgi:trigger factor